MSLVRLAHPIGNLIIIFLDDSGTIVCAIAVNDDGMELLRFGGQLSANRSRRNSIIHLVPHWRYLADG